MEEEPICCVCFQLFVDPHTPKLLGCPHVVCEVCLNCLVKDSAIRCPQCRAITRVPKDGVSALRTIFRTRNLADIHLKHLQNQEHRFPEQSVAKRRKIARKIESSAELTFSIAISGIASNRSGDILAISEGSVFSIDTQVHIYCKQSHGQYLRQSSLNVTGPQFDQGCCFVAISADKKYLVAKGRSIHVYSTSGQYQRVCYTAPTHTDTFRLSCITTTKNGKIIAGDFARSVITVHTTDGTTLLKTIKTSFQPKFIAAIDESHIVISQHSANKVCVIHLESGRETLFINIDKPMAVCYDEDTDCVLIGRGSGAIDQYTQSTGCKAASIAQNLDWPAALVFTGDGTLAVGDCQTVKLYTAT